MLFAPMVDSTFLLVSFDRGCKIRRDVERYALSRAAIRH